jgi:hypothetical protein
VVEYPPYSYCIGPLSIFSITAGNGGARLQQYCTDVKNAEGTIRESRRFLWLPLANVLLFSIAVIQAQGKQIYT